MTVQSIVRAFEILEHIAERSAGSGVTEVAAHTGLPKSTTSRMLRTLEAIGVLGRVPNGTNFVVSDAFALKFSPRTFPENLIALARPFMISLNSAVGEDVGLAVPDGDHVLYIDQISNDAAVQVKNWTGERFPLHLVSSGKVILAYQEATFLKQYVKRPLTASTPNTLTSPTAIKKAIAKICAQGVDWSYGEFDLTINAVSAPILNQQGQVLAVLNIYGPAFRFPAPGGEAEITQLILRESRQLTAMVKRMMA